MGRSIEMTSVRLLYVHEYRDRHGKRRRYFRRRGYKQISLPGEPGSPEFMKVYTAALSGNQIEQQPKHGDGTLSRLAARFYGSIEFSNLKPSSRAAYRAVLDPILEAHGHRTVSGLDRARARKIVESIGSKRRGMANLSISVMRRLMSYAIDLGLRTDNPFARLAEYKIGTHHTWTDDELAAFEKRWPVGTRERLAYALLLYTGQRGGDVVNMLRSDANKGSIRVVQQKTGEELLIAVHPALTRAIKAAPANGVYLMGDLHGRKITRGALTRLMRRAAEAAGLPPRCVAHGLRKAAMRRLAEHSASTKEIAAVSGHATLKEVERYTKKADQARLSKAAIARLPGDDG
jgi:integrase